MVYMRFIFLVFGFFLNEVISQVQVEILMLNYIGNGSRWDNDPCDVNIFNQFLPCDPGFIFCLDEPTGNDSPSHCRYSIFVTTEYKDMNSVTFGPDMNGVANPILVTIPQWQAGFKFKIQVIDYDLAVHDEMDTMLFLYTGIPATSRDQTNWTTVSLVGIRAPKSKIDFKLKVYNQDATTVVTTSASNTKTSAVQQQSTTRDNTIDNAQATQPRDNSNNTLVICAVIAAVACFIAGIVVLTVAVRHYNKRREDMVVQAHPGQDPQSNDSHPAANIETVQKNQGVAPYTSGPGVVTHTIVKEIHMVQPLPHTPQTGNNSLMQYPSSVIGKTTSLHKGQSGFPN